MSRGWDAVGSVGASLLARGQRKRDLDDERKWQTEQAELEWKRGEAKRKFDQELVEARIAKDEALAAAAKRESDRKAFAGTASGDGATYIYEQPDGSLARGERQATPDARLRDERSAANNTATNAARIKATQMRIDKPSAGRAAAPKDYTVQLAKLSGEAERIAGMSEGEVVAKAMIAPSEVPFWKQNQLNAINAQRKQLEQGSGLLTKGENGPKRNPEFDAALKAQKQENPTKSEAALKAFIEGALGIPEYK